MTAIFAQVASFLTTPALAWAGAAAVSIPILIHLLSRLRRKPQAWGAMRFLWQAYRQHRQRLRLEQWLLLVLRCLIVLLLGLALAGPLLSGWAGRLGRPGSIGRRVYLVIDDSLSTRALQSGGAPRFEALRDLTLQFMEGLEPTDTVAVWRAGRPSAPLIERPTLDHTMAQRAIDALTPRYSRPDLPEALRQVARSLEVDGGLRPGEPQPMVVLVSDFSRSAGYLDVAPPPPLRALAEKVQLWVVQPMPGAANMQVMSVMPRRRMVVPGPRSGSGGSLLVPVEVRVRRFDDGVAKASASVELALVDAGAAAVAPTIKRRVRWTPGQSVATLQVDLVAPADAARPRGLTTGAGRVLAVRARLEDRDASDVLREDNERLAVVELRSGLRVAVIDESEGHGSGAEAVPWSGETAALTPGRWLSAALVPDADGRSAGPGPIERVPLLPAEVGEQSLGTLDALVVLRPDLLGNRQWDQLARFAQRGGLVWIFVPVVADTTARWTRPMRRAFSLSWQIDLEPKVVGVNRQGVGLDVNRPVPGPLLLLAADWEALLRPIRVRRRLMVQAADPETWLRLRTTDDSGGSALLAAHDLGAGVLLLLAAAVDPDWTNLPTKPLFVPLLHETLRGVLGRPRGVDQRPVVAGDQPLLDGKWAGVSALQPLPLEAGSRQVDGASIGVKSTDAGRQPVEPLAYPGLYGAASGPTTLKLAVGVDADAGDTRALGKQQLDRWLSRMGDWAFLDRDDPASALRRLEDVVNIGWTLLWLALALVLLETAAARLLSHVGITAQHGLGRAPPQTVRPHLQSQRVG